MAELNISRLHMVSDIKCKDDGISFKYCGREYSVKYVGGDYCLFCGDALTCKDRCTSEPLDFSRIKSLSVRGLVGLLVYLNLACSTDKISQSVREYSTFELDANNSYDKLALEGANHYYYPFKTNILEIGNDLNYNEIELLSAGDDAFSFQYAGDVYECEIVECASYEDRFSDLYDKIVAYNNSRNYSGKVLSVRKYRLFSEDESEQLKLGSLSFIPSLNKLSELSVHGWSQVVSILGIICPTYLYMDSRRDKDLEMLDEISKKCDEILKSKKDAFKRLVLGIEVM